MDLMSPLLFCAMVAFLPQSLVLSFPSTFAETNHEDIFYQVDLNAVPNDTFLAKIRGKPNHYYLFTRQNPDSSQVLLQDDETSVKSSFFNANVPTVVVVHGWLEDKDSKINPTIKTALLENSDVNVIVVDWSRLSMVDYVTAATGVPSVGRSLGHFLMFLKDTAGISYDQVHLVGFSLGSHVVGNAGRVLNGQIARITALDPAGPLWYANDERLRSTDARYVEAIHTNAGSLGIEMTVGDADFFPNGGSLQPGCTYSLCNHNRSWQLFAMSMNNTIIGRQCTNIFQFIINQCAGPKFPLGNNDLNKFGTGVYTLKTGSNYY